MARTNLPMSMTPRTLFRYVHAAALETPKGTATAHITKKSLSGAVAGFVKSRRIELVKK